MKAELAGVQVRAITEAAMNGEIDFSEALNNMALLEGLSEEVLQTVAENFLLPKAHQMKALKYYGYKTAILSGGLLFFGKYLQKNWESIMYMLMNLKLSMEINRN
jgi:phosphoserine phosphatase